MTSFATTGMRYDDGTNSMELGGGNGKSKGRRKDDGGALDLTSGRRAVVNSALDMPW